MTNPNSPAFPEELGKRVNHGLTKREYFAAAALTGLIANDTAKANAPRHALQVADEMMKLLSEPGAGEQ